MVTHPRWQGRRLHDTLAELDAALGYGNTPSGSKFKVAIYEEGKSFYLAVMLPISGEFRKAREWCAANQIIAKPGNLPSDGHIVQLTLEGAAKRLHGNLPSTAPTLRCGSDGLISELNVRRIPTIR